MASLSCDIDDLIKAKQFKSSVYSHGDFSTKCLYCMHFSPTDVMLNHIANQIS